MILFLTWIVVKNSVKVTCWTLSQLKQKTMKYSKWGTPKTSPEVPEVVAPIKVSL